MKEVLAGTGSRDGTAPGTGSRDRTCSVPAPAAAVVSSSHITAYNK